MASLGYPVNYNMAIFVLVAFHANVVNIPWSCSQYFTAIAVFGPLHLRQVNDHEFFLMLVVLYQIVFFTLAYLNVTKPRNGCIVILYKSKSF